MWRFCFFRKKVYTEDILNTVLKLKLERYKLTEEEYRQLRKMGISDDDLEKYIFQLDK